MATKNQNRRIVPPGQPRKETPNVRVLDHAQQYREVAEDLFHRQGGPNPNVLPLLTCCSLALELFLKALTAENVYQDLGLQHGSLFQGMHQVTAESPVRDHKLSRIFHEVPEPIRHRLEAAFTEQAPISGGTRLVDLIARYDTLFVDSRYSFEQERDLPQGSVNDLVRLVSWLGDQIAAMPRERIFDEPESMLKHPACVVGNTIVLDSGGSLPDESIVEVEVDDGSIPDEQGVVEAGIIKLDWPGAIPEGTKVNVGVTGTLLSFDKIDPAHKIGDRAVSGGIADLAAKHDHYLYGHPKVEER